MFPQISIKGNPEVYKNRILSFISAFADAVFLDSNNGTAQHIPITGVRYNYIAAAGISDVIHADHNNLEQLQHFIEISQAKKEWVFGFLSYDLKNELENLTSENPDHTGFPLFHFFSARHVFIATNNDLTIIDDENPDRLWQQVKSISDEVVPSAAATEVRVAQMLNRDNYLRSVKKLLHHIQVGDIYEINFCHEILVDTVNLEPFEVYKRLNSISPNPFSCYYQTRGLHLMCASPERFLTKRGTELISQPIKGTSARGANEADDQINLSILANSDKERSENVMIVDLVRNDLSKIAEKGTVKVEELCGIYTYPKVHQMISTVGCSLKPGMVFMDVIRALFPMGSMTGAPKISAMKIIDQNENFKRTLFSGTVGYINPEGDFDFNVVIRSILYQESTGVASVTAGGAITAASNPEREYFETLVKLSPQLQALGLNADNLLKDYSDGFAI